MSREIENIAQRMWRLRNNNYPVLAFDRPAERGAGVVVLPNSNARRPCTQRANYGFDCSCRAFEIAETLPRDQFNYTPWRSIIGAGQEKIDLSSMRINECDRSRRSGLLCLFGHFTMLKSGTLYPAD